MKLQPICSKLLQDKANASTALHSLDALNVALGEIGDKSLRGCQEYVLLPLLLYLDSIAASRTPAGLGPALKDLMSAVGNSLELDDTHWTFSRLKLACLRHVEHVKLYSMVSRVPEDPSNSSSSDRQSC